MKWMLLTVIAGLCKAVLRGIYAFLKLFPAKNKVSFLSRQSDSVREDFTMIAAALQSASPDTQCVFLCRTLRGAADAPAYFLHLLRCMYHIATSKVCITDTYSIPLCILHHKKGLTIIQIWHSLGAIKKFGYQSLGRIGGRSEKMARLMHMHRGYSYVLCASAETRALYAQAFDMPEEKILLTGIPRIDAILHAGEEENRARLLDAYPALKEKKILLYVPTFRTAGLPDLDAMDACIDHDRYELVVKLHPLDAEKLRKQGKSFDRYPEIPTLRLMTVADAIITDYSAISIEASLLNRPVYFYLYDLSEYLTERGLNFNPLTEMPDCAFCDFPSLFRRIDAGNYDFAALAAFRKRFVETCDTQNTERIVSLIFNHLEAPSLA